MAELKIGGKLETLGGCDVTISGEDHICYWATGERCTANQLANEVETALLVGDCHDDADGNEQNCADTECEEEAIPGQVDGITAFGK